MSHCKNVTASAISWLGDRAPQSLTKLNITNICNLTSVAVTQLLSANTQLKELFVANNSKVGDKAFADTMVMISSLEKLTLSKTAISSFGVACMAERCTSLVSLDITGLESISDAALSVVAATCGRLQELVASDCFGLTDR